MGSVAHTFRMLRTKTGCFTHGLKLLYAQT